MRKRPPQGPYSRTLSRALWWSYGGCRFLRARYPCRMAQPCLEVLPPCLGAIACCGYLGSKGMQGRKIMRTQLGDSLKTRMYIHLGAVD